MLRHGLSTLIALVSFGAALAVLLVTAFHFPEQPDPFAPYDALTPGQPVSALDEYACRYTPIPADMMVDMIFCQIVPESGPIRLVTVLGQDETIKGLSFALEGVQVGHLAQRWGRPDAVQKGRGFAVTRWGNHMQATAQTFGWFTYQAGVDLVVMRDEEHNTAAQIH